MKEHVMLRKSLLSLLVAAATISTASAATVYNNEGTVFNVTGRVQANLNSKYANNNSEKTDKTAIEGSARLGLNGQTKLNEDFAAVAFAEWNVASESSENGKFDTRFAYLGFESEKFGNLHIGQDYTAMYNVVGITDVFQDTASEATTFWDLGGGRHEGQAVYTYKLGGLYAAGSYQTAGLDNVEHGFALAAGYAFDASLPVSLNAGYDTYELKANDEYNKRDLHSWAGSVSLGTLGDGVYAAALYQRTIEKTNTSYDSYELVAGYGFANGLGFLVGYNERDDKDDTLLSNTYGEISYTFNSNFLVWAQASIGTKDVVQENGKKDRADNKYSIRAQYNF